MQEISCNPHQEEIGDDCTGDDHRQCEQAAWQQVGVDPVRKPDDEGKPDQEHYQRKPERDSVDRVAGKITVLGVDQVVVSRIVVSVNGGDHFFWQFLQVRQQAHGIPAMFSLSCVHNPVVTTHHFIKALEHTHTEGCAEDADNQQ